MTLVLGKKALMWARVFLGIAAFLISSTWYTTRFIDGIMTEQRNANAKLDTVISMVRTLKVEVVKNSAGVSYLTAAHAHDSIKVSALMQLLPVKQRISFWNEVRNRDRIELRPVP